MDFIHKPTSRARSVTIRLNSEGQVVVSTPMRFPASKIPEVVEKAQDWIHRQQARFERQVSQQSTEPTLLLEGVEYVVTLKETGPAVELLREQKQCFIHPVTRSQTSICSALERYVKSRAQETLSAYTDEWAKQMNVSFSSLTFRDQKSRWGSCSSRKSLNFNWKLMHAPVEVAQYVVIHELAHLIHMNHSPKFWSVVREFDPRYDEHRSWLKLNGTRVHTNIQQVSRLVVAL